ncbi:hypothetical protein ACGFXC_10415 [Streptomyces sp. NPDC048507]|uniref:hypothetical protein n=1 Tax=Streptomyces sp. NPDC048507 TaxID=3365560 RepID=UPI00370F7EF9
MAWPDAVLLLTSYLRPLVAPIPVVSRVPQDSTPRPPLVQLRLVGGAALPPVRDRARVDVFTWHTGEPEALALMMQVRTRLWALAGTSLLGGTPCYQVGEFTGPRLLDDSPSGTSRAWMTVEFDLRADSAIQPTPR